MSAVAEQIKRISRYSIRHGALPERWYVGRVELEEIERELGDRLFEAIRRKSGEAPKIMGVQLVARADF
jgi:hypothetical protein